MISKSKFIIFYFDIFMSVVNLQLLKHLIGIVENQFWQYWPLNCPDNAFNYTNLVWAIVVIVFHFRFPNLLNI